MFITRELEKMEVERRSLIAEFRIAFEHRGFDVGQYSDELVSNAVRRSEGTWGAPRLHYAFGLLTHGSTNR